MEVSDEDRDKLDAYFERLMTREGIMGQIRLFETRIKLAHIAATRFDRDDHGNTYASIIAGDERQLAYWKQRLDELDGNKTENASDQA